MSANVFVDSDDGLMELSQSAYDSEDLFQGLLGDHPRPRPDLT